MKYLLADLEVRIVGDSKTFNCSHQVGEGLRFTGENFEFLPGTKCFSHYAFAVLVPFIAAKQRATQETDWMYYETDIACPDPQCGAVMRFKRVEPQEYEY
jgi:uncharacterized repeat protein (TIGR04076 family)